MPQCCHKRDLFLTQIQIVKKCISFENTPRRSPTIHIWSQMYSVSYTIGNPEKRFLTWWPRSLTYDLRTWRRYPSIWPTYRISSLYVCLFSRESGNTVTHTQACTRHVTDVGCNNTWEKKKRIRFENTPCRFCTVVFSGFFLGISINEGINKLQKPFYWNVFWPRDLDLWPMPLTYIVDLDIRSLYLHAKNQDCLFVRAPAIVVTRTHTDRHMMSKLLHLSRQRRGV